jgi:DNA ligase-1
MKLVGTDDVRAWLGGSGTLSDHVRALGRTWTDRVYSERALGLPLHLRFVIERLSHEHPEGVPRDALDSIPFFSLCKGLFLPLSGLIPEKVAATFGMQASEPPDAKAREALLEDFLGREVGLTLEQKLGCVLGDPFLGKPSTFRRDSLLRLLASVKMVPRRELLDRLPSLGDVAALFAEARPRLHEEPALSAAEVLATLRFLPAAGRNFKFELLRSLLARMGKLEAYFLAKLMLRRAGFGFDYQGPLLARSLAKAFETDEDRVEHAIALTSVFHVSKLLADEGPEALRKIVLQPLSPVRPALASTAEEIARFPVFVERKYDGIRLMLHKSSDARGSVLCGAYTRNRNDWLELVPGLDATIKLLPCRNAIVDGELHGTVIDLDRARPATVYEVHASLQGERTRPVNLRFAAFDLVYLDGQDLTRLPLQERRRRLSFLVGGLAAMPLPVPVTLSEGQLATSKEDVNRLFHHFRAQGYEGIIAKDLEQPYAIGARDPSWVKRKPELTLDLVLLGAVLAVTTKENAGRFGSYVIAARDEKGAFVDVGDVAGVDRERDFQIQTEIQRAGLLTGRRIERPSSSGVRPGFELRPSIVVTVRFEGITQDGSSRTLKLRDPKLVAIRADKGASEADTVASIEQAYLRQRMG